MSLRAAFAAQAEACEALGSPFMGKLMQTAGSRISRASEPGAFMLDWPGNPHHSADSLPLRFAGALHYLVLSGADADLARLYPPAEVVADRLWDAVERAMAAHGDVIIASMRSPPQTNEIRRSVALIPALHLIAAETGLPLMLSELGASAGLNLLCDQFHLAAGSVNYGPDDSNICLRPDWLGKAPAPADLRISDRAGVDLAPFDLSDPAQQMRLLSYIWPDQPERMGNIRAALDLARATPPGIAKADAVDWLAARLPMQAAGTAHVVLHTIAWQYFAQAARQRGRALIERAGDAATASRPLAHLAMEADDHRGGKGAALTLRVWPGGTLRQLARVDFHGRWIEWMT